MRFLETIMLVVESSIFNGYFYDMGYEAMIECSMMIISKDSIEGIFTRISLYFVCNNDVISRNNSYSLNPKALKIQ